MGVRNNYNDQYAHQLPHPAKFSNITYDYPVPVRHDNVNLVPVNPNLNYKKMQENEFLSTSNDLQRAISNTTTSAEKTVLGGDSSKEQDMKNEI